MEQVVPWPELCAVIAPFYRKNEGGRPAVGLERMLRIYFLQQRFNLSEPAAQAAPCDSAAMRHTSSESIWRAKPQRQRVVPPHSLEDVMGHSSSDRTSSPRARVGSR